MTRSTAEAVRTAAEHFSAGQFDAAESIYLRLAEEPRARAQATLRLGYLALLNNQAPSALTRLAALVASDPGNYAAKRLLAQACYQCGDYGRAASHFAELGRPAFAHLLSSLGQHATAAPSAPEGGAVVPWLCDAPLPVILAAVNGYPAHLVIDTGAGALTLDAEFAKRAHMRHGFAERADFAGGVRAQLQHVVVDELKLGGVSLHGLPAHSLDLQSTFEPFFPQLVINGVIGTDVFRHFVTEIDYPAARLRLSSAAGSDPSSVGERFWMADSHYLVAHGRVNNRATGLLFIDSGMSGTAFAASPTTAAQLQLPLDASDAHTGYGGGGQIRSLAFRLDRLCCAGRCQGDVKGLVLHRFPLESELGFRLGGVVADEFLRGAVVRLDFGRMRLSWA